MSKKAIVSVILLLLPLLAAADEVQIDGLWYNIDSNGNTAQVIQYKDNVKYEGDIVIPSTVTYDGVEYSVTSIGNYAFYNCSSLTEINIPQGITTIGSCAFDGCSGLTKAKFSSIESLCNINFSDNYGNPLYYAHHLYINEEEVTNVIIPSSITTIRNYTFYGCSSITAISIPQEVTSIGISAFSGCSSLTTINIPQGVTSIEWGVFQGCSNLTEINIPQGVTSIGVSAFSGCSSLTEINIPESMTSIKSGAFGGCSRLTEIRIPENVTTIGDEAFRDCSILTEITIPQGITRIAYGLFRNCSSLTEIIIPQEVISIGRYAFSGCSSLTAINIPQGVTTVEQYTFSGCSSLTDIIIPQGVTSIGMSAFNGCISLTKAEFSSIEDLCNIDFFDSSSNPLTYAHHLFINGEEVTNVIIPNSVTSIGNYTFKGCSFLTEIGIPEGVTSIGISAFESCSSLTEIDIPQGVTTIEDNAFAYCSNLTGIIIPQGVEYIGHGAFVECPCPTTIIIPEGCSTLGQCVFGSYGTFSNLISVYFPETITTIPTRAFQFCESLSDVHLSQSTTTIESWAFEYCPSLTKFTIPQNVTNIGTRAFQHCDNLESLFLYPSTPPVCGNYVFSSVPTESCVLYVPAESIEAYSTTSPWSSFTHIQPLEVNSISEEEWAILGTIKDDLVGKGWSRPWDMSIGINLAESLQGITVANKHVTQLNLSNCQLNGSFPLIVLQLPYLEQLNLSNNQLHGDVCTGIDDANQLVALETLTSISLSHNQLTGNIGAFASHFPQLQSLDASYNSLTEVAPMISSSVTNLNIGYQSINQTYDFDLTNPSHDYLFQQLPSLLRYDHTSQSYKNTIKFCCTAGDVATYSIHNSNGQWGAEVTLDHEQGEWTIPFVSSNYAFQGENGSQLQAMLLDDSRSKTGNTFGLTLRFASGDANFDGDVDVTDLQTTILEIMAQHGQTPFNFTAANINNDYDLNVLDVILQVNQLMSMSPASMPRANKLKASVANTSASVYVDNGNLIIYSDTPVAAFDIRVSDASLLSLSETLTLAGMTCSVKEGNDGLHLIGYSLTGGLLPTGETCIATLKGTAPTVATAVLADEQARKVATTCNQQPTGITTIGSAQVDIRQDGHQIVLRTDSSGETLFWQLASPDGRVLGKGEADVDGSNTCTIPIDIRHHGLIIVTVRSANKTLINKLINIR